jgi:pimeloyl-ACP methyl ester carboxylesterase
MQRLALAVIAACLIAAAPAHAAVKPGPSGDAFYTPPPTLPSGPHGTPIWERKLTSPAVLKGAKANRLVLYRSTSPDGKPTAISGTVAIPKGKAPKGGWPVVAWAHGTVGIADACTPSRIGTPANYDGPLLTRWLKAGYAVVRTDYEGLGTPDVHPYLNGVSAGRSVLDIVRAARKLDRRIGKRVVIAGHSQGGQAALWAAALAPKWTPELKVQATVAFAPVSHLGEQASLLGALSAPSGLSALAALITRGLDAANPALNIRSLLSDRAAAIYHHTDERCVGELAAQDSFGALAPAEFFRAGTPPAEVIAALNASDAETLKIRGPVLIAQGGADTTVLPGFTDALADGYRKRKVKLTYKTYAGVDHAGIVLRPKPANDAYRWVVARR